MHKRTSIDQIEILKDGTFAIRMAKEIVDDDPSVPPLRTGWHRTMIPPGIDVDDQMEVVNQNLTRDLGYPPVPEEDIERIRVLVPVVHTKEVKDAYKAKK